MIIKRILILEKEVIGELFINDMFVCNTLENKYKLINRGLYNLRSDITSPKFKMKLPRLEVEGRSGILIHAGNRAEDTEGCILVGTYTSGDRIWNSKIYLKKVINLINYNNINKVRICGKI